MVTQRDPDKTRKLLLVTAFGLIFKHGFQGLRIDEVLKESGLKKGALYHHFENKQALGYAVLDELISPMIDEIWITPLNNNDDPLVAMKMVREFVNRDIKEGGLQQGCPLNNLAQEMSSLDAGFQQRIDAIFKRWIVGTENSLIKGQKLGYIRGDINTRNVSTFIVASAEGCIGLAKGQQSEQVFHQCADALDAYLVSLRPAK